MPLSIQSKAMATTSEVWKLAWLCFGFLSCRVILLLTQHGNCMIKSIVVMSLNILPLIEYDLTLD